MPKSAGPYSHVFPYEQVGRHSQAKFHVPAATHGQVESFRAQPLLEVKEASLVGGFCLKIADISNIESACVCASVILG